MQVNLHKAKQGQIEIAKRIKKLNTKASPFICLAQEPLTGKNGAMLQPNTCQRFSKGTHPRAIIYASSQLKIWFIETLSTPDIVVAQTKIKNRSTLIISAYLDIQNTDVIPDALDTAMQYAHDKGLAILVAMDSNAHSSSYGPTNNTRGEKIDLFIARHQLHIENTGNTPTFQARNCETFIDVTLTSNLAVSVADWRVCQDYNGSDHNTILFHTHTDLDRTEPQWRWDKADWDLFQAEVKKADLNIPHIIFQEDCDTIVTEYYKIIYKAMKKAIPKSKPKIIDKNNP